MGAIYHVVPVPPQGAFSGVATTIAGQPGSPAVVPSFEWKMPPPEPARDRGSQSPVLEGRDTRRCAEKGCIFPAQFGHFKCLHHSRQEAEPALYQSHQPTLLVVERGKFDVEAEQQPDLSRGRDRRRMAVEREAFLEE